MFKFLIITTRLFHKNNNNNNYNKKRNNDPTFLASGRLKWWHMNYSDITFFFKTK